MRYPLWIGVAYLPPGVVIWGPFSSAFSGIFQVHFW
jgi:hypothetical protein